MTPKQDYNQLAAAYGRNRNLHPMVLEQLIIIGELGPDSRVLEIGCGTGNYIRAIAAATGAISTGVDPSREMLRIAASNHGLPKHRRKPGEAEVTFIRGTTEDVPMSGNQFDLLYSVDVIHHVQNRVDAASEMFRLLKPGGVAAIVTESEDDLRHRTPNVPYFPDIMDVELDRYPALDVIRRELADAGLALESSIPVSMPYEVNDLRPFRDKAFSSLHLIPDEAFASGIARMEEDLRDGPIRGNRRYTMVIARRPA